VRVTTAAALALEGELVSAEDGSTPQAARHAATTLSQEQHAGVGGRGVAR